MQAVEYFTEITQGGNLILPDFVKKQLASFSHHQIKVHIEVVENDESGEYSFYKVRRLLRPIQGNLSADVLADRGER